MKATLHQMVTRFHSVAKLPIHHRPHTPSDERVRLRLRLITEEFFELLESAMDLDDLPNSYDHAIKQGLKDLIEMATVRVDLPEFADALADMDYINEGTRLEFGIDGQSVLEEVHRANMNKFTRCEDCHGSGTCELDLGNPSIGIINCSTCDGGGFLALCRDDGKIVKPDGWRPPNIEHVLLEQGWTP